MRNLCALFTVSLCAIAPALSGQETLEAKFIRRLNDADDQLRKTVAATSDTGLNAQVAAERRAIVMLENRSGTAMTGRTVTILFEPASGGEDVARFIRDRVDSIVESETSPAIQVSNKPIALIRARTVGGAPYWFLTVTGYGGRFYTTRGDQNRFQQSAPSWVANIVMATADRHLDSIGWSVGRALRDRDVLRQSIVQLARETKLRIRISPVRTARACREGDIGACAIVLGLTRSPNWLADDLDSTGRRSLALLTRRVPPVVPEARARACIHEHVDSVCLALLRAEPVIGRSLPAGPEPVWLFIRVFGWSKYELLRARAARIDSRTAELPADVQVEIAAWRDLWATERQSSLGAAALIVSILGLTLSFARPGDR